MPVSKKQRAAACSRAAGRGKVMKSMPKTVAKKWCGSKLHKKKRR